MVCLPAFGRLSAGFTCWCGVRRFTERFCFGHGLETSDSDEDGLAAQRRFSWRWAGQGHIPRYMPEKPAPLLARILFPRFQPHLQRKYLRQLCAAIVVGLLVAGAITALMLVQADKFGPR